MKTQGFHETLCPGNPKMSIVLVYGQTREKPWATARCCCCCGDPGISGSSMSSSGTLTLFCLQQSREVLFRRYRVGMTSSDHRSHAHEMMFSDLRNDVTPAVELTNRSGDPTMEAPVAEIE